MAHSPAPLSPTDPVLTPERIPYRRLLFQMVLIILVVGGALAALGYFFREPLTAASAVFIDAFGPTGIALGFFLPDGLLAPLPHEAFLAAGLLGGLPGIVVGTSACIGSLVGGSLGWLIGRYLGKTARLQRYFAGRGRRGYRLLHDHGTVALAVGAVTPLPYSVMTWASGATGMSYTRFITVSLLRIPRIFFYLWLVNQGIVIL